MTFKDVIAELFDFTPQTWYKWKKENRPIVNLIEKYFSKEDLAEFIATGRVKKFDNLTKDVDSDFYLTNAKFKISKMKIHEIALLEFTMRKNRGISSKRDLITAIEAVRFSKLTFEKILESMKLFRQDRKDVMSYTYDQANLVEFITEFLSEQEVESLLKASNLKINGIEFF